jgi:hypothetical protein
MRFVLMFALSWIFLPGRYTHQLPVRPHVAALPTPQIEVNSWQYTRVWDRNGGYYRVERYGW